MQIGRETILRWCNGIKQHEGADLSSMTYAVGDNMHEHLLPRYAARGTVRKLKVDSIRQFFGCCISTVTIPPRLMPVALRFSKSACRSSANYWICVQNATYIPRPLVQSDTSGF